MVKIGFGKGDDARVISIRMNSKAARWYPQRFEASTLGVNLQSDFGQGLEGPSPRRFGHSAGDGAQFAGAASVWLRLGRVSNLPTVWSNGLAGAALSGATAGRRETAIALFALSALYVGGMYLNDAFDRGIDARDQPFRPIPSGLVSAKSVFAIGFSCLGVGVAMLAWSAPTPGARADGVAAALALAAAIVLYNAWHKGNPIGPLLMGICRALAYFAAGLALGGGAAPALFAGAATTLGFLIGLTYIAKQEKLRRGRHLWPLLFLAAPLCFGISLLRTETLSAPLACIYSAIALWTAAATRLFFRRRPGDIGRAVARLIAGISLIDAGYLWVWDGAASAALAVGCFAATLTMQRWVRGT